MRVAGAIMDDEREVIKQKEEEGVRGGASVHTTSIFLLSSSFSSSHLPHSPPPAYTPLMSSGM